MDIDYKRQRKWLPYRPKQAVIVGLGTVGSWCALALAKMGTQRLVLFDDDRVEAHNVPNQAYSLGDCGKHKVETLSLPDSQVVRCPERCYTLASYDSDAYILAVDNIDTRFSLAKAAPNKGLLVDVRLGPGTAEIYAFDLASEASKERYFAEAHDFAQDTADNGDGMGADCGAVSTIATAMLQAGLVAGLVAAYMRGVEPRFCTVLSSTMDGGVRYD